MIPLSNRQTKIIYRLLEKEDYVIANDLAVSFSVSSRTIRYDLDQIKAFLNEHGFVLENVAHKGFRLLLDEKDKALLEELLDDARLSSADENVDLILLELLIHEKTTYEQLSRFTRMSRYRIASSLNLIEKRLTQFGMKLVKEKGSGIYLSGEEFSFRECLRQLIENADRRILKETMEIFAGKFHRDLSDRIISASEEELQISFYDEGKLEVLIAYTIFRIFSGHPLLKLPEIAFQIVEDENYDAYMKILSNFFSRISKSKFLIIFKG